jgi:hypothetical protein
MRRLLIGVALLLTACSNPLQGTTTSPTATPSPTPSATPTPVPSPTLVNGRVIVSNLDDNGDIVVAGILFPPSGTPCGNGGSFDGCPVTDGLAQRLDANPLKQANPLCRCQNGWQSRTISSDPLPAGNPGAIAHVVLNFGPGSTEKFDVTILRTSGGWFASDTACTGKDPAATSIYAATPPPCG